MTTKMIGLCITIVLTLAFFIKGIRDLNKEFSEYKNVYDFLGNGFAPVVGVSAMIFIVGYFITFGV